MSRDEIAAVVTAFGDIARVVQSADRRIRPTSTPRSSWRSFASRERKWLRFASIHRDPWSAAFLDVRERSVAVPLT
jgi:hypothetical protein